MFTLLRIHLRFLLSLIAVLAVVIASFVGPASAQAHHHRAHATDGKQGIAKGHLGTGRPVRHPEFTPLAALAARIQQLGDSRYASSFAGTQLTDHAKVLDLYVVPKHDRAFLHAVAAANRRGLPYTIKTVSRSYATQKAAMRWITTHWAALKRQGILLNSWAPSPAYDAVLAALQKPARPQLAQLQHTLVRLRQGYLAKRRLQLTGGMSVTASTYIPVVAAVLNAEAPRPGAIVVSHVFETPFHVANGSADNSPFFGGDLIFYTLNNTIGCTSNFSVNLDSNTTVDYVVTAGHCSGWPPATGHDFYTCYTKNSSNKCDYNMGTVSAAYWNNNDDFELIKVPSAKLAVGYVWINQTSNDWSVNGHTTPVAGSYVTADGWFDGAIYDNYVDEVSGCFTEYNQSGTKSHKICNDIIFDHNGSSPCPKRGDSGGPILVRESGGTYIYAVGIILASNGGQTECGGELIERVRSEADARLIFGSG